MMAQAYAKRDFPQMELGESLRRLRGSYSEMTDPSSSIQEFRWAVGRSWKIHHESIGPLPLFRLKKLRRRSKLHRSSVLVKG